MYTKDPIVNNVLDKYIGRSETGVKTYNTTLEENNKDDFLNHLQEELLDASLYIEKLMSDRKNAEAFLRKQIELYDDGQITRNTLIQTILNFKNK